MYTLPCLHKIFNFVKLNSISELASALPGCHSQGDTEEEAIENIKDAIMGCIEALNQRAQIHDVTERIVEVALG